MPQLDKHRSVIARDAVAEVSAAYHAQSQAHRQQARVSRRVAFFKTDIKVVVGEGMPLIEPLPAVDFRPCRRICESRFSKKFFSKKFLYGWSVCGGAAEGKRNGNYRHGGSTKEMIEVWKLIKSLR